MRVTETTLRGSVAALVLIGAGSAACGRSTQTISTDATAARNEATGSSRSDPSEVATLSATGVISVAGSEPATMLTLLRDSGTALQLYGNLASELRRLSGARVEVRGTPARSGAGDGISVSDYAVVELDGRRPRVGVLATSGELLWLAGQDSLALVDVDGKLGALAGAKVWVVADTTTSPAGVLAYGVLREAP
jgi:hypothetical protein